MSDPDKLLRLMLVDDQILFVESLRCVIEDRAPDIEVVGVAHDGNEALFMAMKLQPDVILMDVRMPGMDGVQATRRIHELYPGIKIVMLTTFSDDDYVKVALKFGATGYLLKNIPPDELLRSVRGVRRSVAQISPEIMARLVTGGTEVPVSGETIPLEILTQREREILELILKAQENHDIATTLGLTEQTVKNHIHKLYQKLGITNRLQLIKLMGLRDN